MPPFVVEMQIVRVEHRHVHQAFEVEDVELLAFELNQFIPPQFLQSPINVDRGETRGVREVVLGQRKIAAAVWRRG